LIDDKGSSGPGAKESSEMLKKNHPVSIMNNSKNNSAVNPQPSFHRKAHFKLESFIMHEGSERIFVKKAVNPEAIPLLSVIIEREQNAKEFFKDYAEVVTGILKDDCIEYPFLDFPSIEKQIEESLKKKDVHSTAELIRGYIQFLQRLPTIECYPDRFIAEFGIVATQINRPITCFTSGPIDCIPSNILVNKHSWRMIDHEWFFDFPIPIDLIIYRGIISLVYRLQDHIQAATSRQSPSVLFDGYGKNRNYIPAAWLSLLQSNMTTSLQHLTDWNHLFQTQILIYENKRTSLRLNKNPKRYKNIKAPAVELILSEFFRYLDKKYRIRESLKSFMELTSALFGRFRN
jgi:hypothetical protein